MFNPFNDNFISQAKNIGSDLIATDILDLEALIELSADAKNSKSDLETAIKAGSQAVQDYANSVGYANINIKEFEKSQSAFSRGLGNMNIKSRLAAAGVGILNAVLNVGIGLLVGVAINGIIKLADTWIHRNERLIESANELSASYKQALDDISSSLSRVNSLKEEFAELSKGVDNFGNNVSLDTRSYERYLAS